MNSLNNSFFLQVTLSKSKLFDPFPITCYFMLQNKKVAVCLKVGSSYSEARKVALENGYSIVKQVAMANNDDVIQ